MDGSMDPAAFRSTMTSLNHGVVMEAAARNLQREMLRDAADAGGGGEQLAYDMQAIGQDEELEQLHRDRIAQLKREAEKRTELSGKGHGEYQEVSAGEFIPAVTGSSHAVCHFYHNEFERCRILDKHLALLAKKYFKTRFVKLHAPDATFFTERLNVTVLPCVVMFLKGNAYDRIVGFDEFGTRDDFDTAALERRLLLAGVVEPPERDEDEEAEAEERRGAVSRIRKLERGPGDEDSDFE